MAALAVQWIKLYRATVHHVFPLCEKKPRDAIRSFVSHMLMRFEFLEHIYLTFDNAAHELLDLFADMIEANLSQALINAIPEMKLKVCYQC